MSPEQQFLINIIAIVLGPIVAVLITLIYQSNKEKRDSKMRLFTTLMAYRKTFPPPMAWVESLNLIDVVFSKNTKVVQLWHEYYALLHQSTQDFAQREHKYLELLSEMAKVLNYKNLQQTDIDKFYSPVAHGNQNELNVKVQTELLRVLENTESLKVIPSEKT